MYGNGSRSRTETLVSGQSDLGALRTFMLYTNTVVVRNSGAGEVQNIETDAKHCRPCLAHFNVRARQKAFPPWRHGCFRNV